MKITSEKDEQSQVILRIEIEPAELEEAKGKAARKLSNQVRIPGFRPGKAPRALVERFVGQAGLIEQATRDLIPKAYENALKDQEIKPIGQPEIDIESQDPLTIVATIPVEPTVELGSYKEIRLDMPPVELSDEEVEKVIQQLRDQQSTWEEPETARPAQEGDQVELEIQTVRDGEVSGEPFQRTGVLGKGELLEQIDDQVAGMNVGEEKVIEVKRQPAAAPAPETTETTEPEQKAEAADADTPDQPEVAALPPEEEDTTPLTFKVTLNSIKVKHEPELNDEFAQSVSDAKTFDELKDRVVKNLTAQKEDTSKRELTEKFIKEALALSKVVMPPILVNAEIHSLEENFANRLKQQKLSLDQYLNMLGKSHEDFHEELRPQAEERLRTALILRDIAKAEGVTVEQGDLDREVEKMVDQFIANVPEDEREQRSASMRGFLQQEQMLNQMRDDLFSRKLGDHLIEIATGVTPVEPEPLEIKQPGEEAVPETENKPEDEAATSAKATAEAPTMAEAEGAPEAKTGGTTKKPRKKAAKAEPTE